jgi:hypothetical protein
MRPSVIAPLALMIVGALTFAPHAAFTQVSALRPSPAAGLQDIWGQKHGFERKPPARGDMPAAIVIAREVGSGAPAG